MTTGIGNERYPGDPPEIHNEGKEVNIASEHVDAVLDLHERADLELPQRASAKIYTRNQISELLGMNHSTLARWEHKGRIHPSQRTNNMAVYSEEQFQEIKTLWENSSRNVSAEQKCSSCGIRKARVGSTLCSRCTYSSLETQLRSTLPGMEVKPNVLQGDTDSVTSSGSNSDVEEQILICPTCKSDDPSERKILLTGHPDFPMPVSCNNAFHTQEGATRILLGGLTPGVKYYTRREIAAAIHVSPTTICRWEGKGKTPPPLRMAHSNQLFYTEEHLQKIKAYAELVEQVKPNPLVQAGKGVSNKTFSKLSERAVAVRISGGFRRGTLL